MVIAEVPGIKVGQTGYPFTIIQMRVDAHGKGEGKMSVATRVTTAGNTIVLENYDAQPVLLAYVTVQE